MNTNFFGALLVVVAAPAFAQFSYDASSGACTNAAGEHGFNVGTRGPCGDLSGQTLDGENFQNWDLRGARFEGASLKKASFKGAKLDGASFVRADLTDAVMTGAQLDKASMSEARLVGAHLEHATITNASLAGANVRNACLFGTAFAGADLRTAQFSKQRSVLEGARFAQALVLIDTLPFSAAELARQQVEVRDVLATAR